MKKQNSVLMIACSVQGYGLMEKLKTYMTDNEMYADTDIICKVRCDALSEISETESIADITGKYFDRVTAIIYIAAVGIAVRSIAPYINHKSEDPAVIVIDVSGKFCIPILSGHAGGANELSYKLAQAIGAQAVITTATDVCDIFAVDEYARKNNLIISDWSLAKKISAELLNEEKSTYKIEVSDRKLTSCDKKTLYLIPRDIVVGIGCRRGTDASKIRNAVMACLEENNIDCRAVCEFSSISLKKSEQGIIEVSNELKVPFITYDKEKLCELEGNFSVSDFVKNIAGVDCVCERSAVMGAGGKYESLICNKQIYEDVTVALARREIDIEDEGIICDWNRSGGCRENDDRS